MTKLTFIQPDGRREDVEARDGSSVMLTAIANNIHGIEAECGGALDCATCHIYFDPRYADRANPPSETELALLEGVAADRRPESRLSCQIKISPAIEGAFIAVPDRQL